MNEFEAELQEIIIDAFEMARVVTFQDAGISTNINGLVVLMYDGSEFEIAIKKVKEGMDETPDSQD